MTPEDLLLTEQVVLSGMMASPHAAAVACEKLVPEDFTSDEHRKIFKACSALTHPYTPIDVSLESGLHSEVAHIAALDVSPLIERHVEALIEGRNLSKVRAAIAAATDMLNEGKPPKEITGTFLDRCASVVRGKGSISSKAAASAALDAFLAADAGGNPARTTGFRRLDDLLGGGLSPGSLYVIAARPGIGKSALAMHLVLTFAMRALHACVVSLEMPAAECAGRLLTAISGQRRAYRKDSYSDAGRDALREASERLASWPISFKEDAASTIDAVSAYLAGERLRKDVELLVVDYLQLLTDPPNASSRVQEVSAISRKLKVLAMEARLPVVALSQLNRSLETRANPTPVLSDLRESGSIEQDADVVLMLSPVDAGDGREGVSVHVAKNRNGPLGRLTLTFDKPFGRFAELEEKRL